MSKLMALIRRAPKRFSAVVAIIAAAIIVPAIATAWGPSRDTYTTANPANKITFNSITDNPAHGDERNFVQVREASASNSTYADEISLASGKEYVIYMYYHNNAAANLNLVATGTYAKAQLPAVVPKGSTGTKAVGYIGATNADPVQVWDDVSFKNPTTGDIALRYVPGSATIHNFGATDGKTLSDSIIGSGAPLGYNALDGKVPGCNEFAGYVTFRVKADQPNFTISKQVRLAGTTTWGETVAAKDGDTVDYQLGYTNTGTTAQSNVTLKDVLPKGITYIPGSTYLKNASNPTPKNVSDNLFTSGGLNIGNYTAGSNAFVKFSAKVTVKDVECGNQTLKNVASAHTNNGSKSDDANVTVEKKCEEQPKEIEVCELSTKKTITIKESEFDSTKHSKDLDDCKEEVKYVKVCELATKKIITIKVADFDESKHSKTLSDCEEVEKITVCDLTTKKQIKIDEKDFDATKHSKDLDDCVAVVKDITVCEIATKKIVKIHEIDFDAEKHSKTLDDCDVDDVPEVLPETGIAENIVAILGLGALVASVAYYVASRRALV